MDRIRAWFRQLSETQQVVAACTTGVIILLIVVAVGRTIVHGALPQPVRPSESQVAHEAEKFVAALRLFGGSQVINTRVTKDPDDLDDAWNWVVEGDVSGEQLRRWLARIEYFPDDSGFFVHAVEVDGKVAYISAEQQGWVLKENERLRAGDDAQRDRSAKWVQTVSFKGTGSKQTERFFVTANRWRVTWEVLRFYNGFELLAFDVVSRDGKVVSSGGHTGRPGKDSTYVEGSGEHRLFIRAANCSYEFTVEELR